MVICSDLAHRHVETWLRQHIPPEAHAVVTDVTSGYTLLNIQGPKSRDLMKRITTADVSKEAFPYMSAQNIDINYAMVQVMRVTYEGELGFELYVPTEFSAHVYESVIEAGQDLGLRHAGFQALNSLRIEKAYREYGHDMDNLDTPLEAGLGFAVKLDKPVERPVRKIPIMAPKKAKGMAKRMIKGWK